MSPRLRITAAIASILLVFSIGVATAPAANAAIYKSKNMDNESIYVNTGPWWGWMSPGVYGTVVQVRITPGRCLDYRNGTAGGSACALKAARLFWMPAGEWYITMR